MNYIIGELDIKEVGQKIRIINSYEELIREYEYIEYINNLPLLYLFCLELPKWMPINFWLLINKMGEPDAPSFILQLCVIFELFIYNIFPYDTKISLSFW